MQVFCIFPGFSVQFNPLATAHLNIDRMWSMGCGLMLLRQIVQYDPAKCLERSLEACIIASPKKSGPLYFDFVPCERFDVENVGGCGHFSEVLARAFSLDVAAAINAVFMAGDDDAPLDSSVCDDGKFENGEGLES